MDHPEGAGSQRGDRVVRLHNQRGTAGPHVKAGKHAFRWTGLSCKRFRDNEMRLQLHALACNLATLPHAASNGPRPWPTGRGPVCN